MKNINIEVISKSPGKCLICGGYLILNKNKKGVVINSDTYIETKGKIENYIYKENEYFFIKIFSDYEKKEYKYNIIFKDNSLNVLEDKYDKNKWILNCIKSSIYIYSLNFENLENFFNNLKINSKCISIEIISDYRFYSYNKEKFENNDSKSIKTGLGSSSALTCSINSTLMNIFYLYNLKKQNEQIPQYSNINSIPDKKFKSCILVSSILSNNLSQNKIGSCFDIISSLTGNQIFQQIPYNLFIDNFQFNENNFNLIKNFVNEIKNNYLDKVEFLENLEEKNLIISLISIETGSDTRIFVKNVLEYAKKNMQNELFDDELFSNLNLICEEIILIFQNKKNLNLLKENCIKYRKIIQEISKKSNVEIEPKILSSLLDELISKEEIFYSICPGAGGYDSIVVIGQNSNKSNFINEVYKCVTNFNNIHPNFQAYIIETKIAFHGSLIKYNI